MWDEEAEFYPLRAELEGRSYLGHDGLSRFVAEMSEEWEEIRFEIDEIHDAGERLVGFGRVQAQGRASGVEIDVPLGIVGVIRNKKFFYVRMYSDPAKALEAAGLSD